MFCKKCGAQLNDDHAFCAACGAQKGEGTGFCANCGQPIAPGSAVCAGCGAPVAATGAPTTAPTGAYGPMPGAAPSAAPQVSDKKKIVALLLAIFLGQLGIHNFYLGYTKKRHYSALRILAFKLDIRRPPRHLDMGARRGHKRLSG